jgi:hypothetical protein
LGCAGRDFWRRHEGVAAVHLHPDPVRRHGHRDVVGSQLGGGGLIDSRPIARWLSTLGFSTAVRRRSRHSRGMLPWPGVPRNPAAARAAMPERVPIPRAGPAALEVMSRSKATALYPGSRRAEQDTTSQPVLRWRPRRSPVRACHPPRKTGLRALGVDFRGMPLLPQRDPVITKPRPHQGSLRLFTHRCPDLRKPATAQLKEEQ